MTAPTLTYVRLTWPLTGRSTEMRLIEAALSDRDCSGVVVCGPAGVGKSRIAREATTSAASKGCEVRWAVATTSARTLPLGALASWTGSAGGDGLQLVGGVIESLTSAPDGATVVVGVDDAPLLDDLSIFVVHRIVQRRAAKVVLTVRDGERVPAVQEVLKEGQFDRLELQPLSREDTATLVSAALGGSLDPNAAARLWELTRGNVLYLRNIVEQEVADGRLVRLRGVWRWLGDPVVAPRLVELIEARIGDLPISVSDAVDALAVGEPIELASLSRIAGPAAVEEADMRGLITLETVDAGVQVRLAHPLYGEVRRDRAAPTRLRRLRGLVVAELAKSADCDDVRVVVRRAALSLDSDLEPNPDLLVRAAQGAAWLGVPALGDRIADAAIRAGGPAEANFIRAHALSWLGRGREADTALARTPTMGLTDVDRGRLLFLRATNRLFVLADPAGAKRLIDDASHTAPRQARGFVDAFLTVYWAAMGKPDAAGESSKTLALEELPDLVAARTTAWAITLACGDAGRVSDAVAAANAGYAVPTRSFVVLPDAHVGALLLAGRVAEAWRAAERFRHEVTGSVVGIIGLIPSAVLGRAARGAGRLSAACSLLGPAADACSAGGEATGWWYRCQIPLTTALAMRGLTVEAVAALEALEDCRHPGWRCLDYEYAIAKAWVAAVQGALSEAVATLLSAAETARANGQFAAEVMCLQTATQFGDHSGACRLGELAVIVEGPRAGSAARFGAALAAGDGAALAAVSADFEQMGDLVAAVDAASHAAMAYRGQGLRGSGLGCSARAEALAQRCGARSPALVAASEPLPLTDREREIVSLIGAGLSNREVAARLTISVRTVETHIYNAMAKTGTAGRDDLAALLPWRRPVGESFPTAGRAHYVGDTSDK